MSLDHSWQFVGAVDGWAYRLFDAVRRRLNRKLVRYLLRQMQSVQPAGALRVLEPGCGTGFALSLMQSDPAVRLAVAVDLDESALREGRQRNPRLNAVVADLRHLPFADEAFHLVYNSSTIEHLDDPASAVGEMRRVCNALGRVFVGVPFFWGPLVLQPVVRRTAVGRWVGPVFTRASLAALLQDNELEPLDSIIYFWRFFVGIVARHACPATRPAGAAAAYRKLTLAGASR